MKSYSEEDWQRISRALAWIIERLRQHDVAYQVVGGLAARAYGAHRPLVDIDFYVPFDKATALLEEVRPFITWGPEHHTGDKWDLTYLKIEYRGQRIELGDSSTTPRYFSAASGCWKRQRIEYEDSTSVCVFGVEVEVMPKDELIRYKRHLGREVDLIDIEQLTKNTP
ncbi:hypothetical protein BH24ACT22_BH24ACT22_10710 [soil metagenome]